MEWCFDLEKARSVGNIWPVYCAWTLAGSEAFVLGGGNFTLGDFDRISVGKEILLQIFLSNGSGVCTDFQRCIFENRKARTRMQCLFFVLRNAAWELILRKRNKLQVESALRASSALAGARKEMCILELNKEW